MPAAIPVSLRPIPHVSWMRHKPISDKGRLLSRIFTGAISRDRIIRLQITLTPIQWVVLVVGKSVGRYCSTKVSARPPEFIMRRKASSEPPLLRAGDDTICRNQSISLPASNNDPADIYATARPSDYHR